MPLSSAVRRYSSTEETSLLLTTNHGLEDVAAREAEEVMSAAGIGGVRAEEAPNDRTSYVQVTAAASRAAMIEAARSLRSIHHILTLEFAFRLPPNAPMEAIRAVMASEEVPGMAEAKSFRVSTLRRGDHAFTSVDVMRAAGAGLVKQYGTDVDLEEYDLEVRVDVRGDEVRVAVQQTDAALSKRQQRVFQPPAALSPSVAYVMLRLPYVSSPPQRVVDPFCGSGTIVIEAAHLWPEAGVLGLDRDPEVVEGARRNVAAEGLGNRVDIQQGDALAMDEHLTATPDLLVTNPPFGRRLGAGLDLVTFYRRMLTAAYRALSPDGWFVVLVLKPGAFSGALQNVSASGTSFDVRHVRRVHLGGLHPRVFVMQRGG